MSQLAELLPCPFCGSEPVTSDSGKDGAGLMIECFGDACVGPHVSYYDHATAVRVWNTRAALQSPQAEMPGLPEKCTHRCYGEVLEYFDEEDLRNYGDARESYGRTCAAMQADDWTASAEQINALPEKMRHWVMWLQTDADPAGTLRENWRLGQENAALRVLVEQHVAMQAGGGQFLCCGGSDEEPPEHCMDCQEVERVARVIAEKGVGRPWNDFQATNAHDLDQSDLLAYAQAALTAITAPQAPAVDDTKRLDWLAHHGVSIRQDPDTSQWFLVGAYHMGNPAVDDRKRAETARAAIDAALTAQKGEGDDSAG